VHIVVCGSTYAQLHVLQLPAHLVAAELQQPWAKALVLSHMRQQAAHKARVLGGAAVSAVDSNVAAAVG
jgi:hypothetical protein